jgi:hypothetical protein
VLVEATWYFGLRGRNAASAWRHRLRAEESLAALEAALLDTLSGTAELATMKEPSFAAAPPTELQDIGAVAIVLLDDAPHAALDKKRKRLEAPSVVVTSPADANFNLSLHDGRSYGLAPAVASRFAALLLLSLRDSSVTPRGSTAALIAKAGEASPLSSVMVQPHTRGAKLAMEEGHREQKPAADSFAAPRDDDEGAADEETAAGEGT